MGQGRGAVRAVERRIDVLSEIGFAPREPAPEKIQAADDDRKHVVEVVGKPSSELPYRLHLLRLA
jgi:hypothetical protein